MPKCLALFILLNTAKFLHIQQKYLLPMKYNLPSSCFIFADYSDERLLIFYRFIEYGEYKNNYYGTSIDSVRSVLAKNKVCLLDVQPHVSKPLSVLPLCSSL